MQGERLLRVLMVDDSELQLAFAQALLAEEDIELFTAHDGQEAVMCALECRPDLILMDIVMPTMSGIEAARVLRKEPVTAAIPIIMVTSQCEAEYMEDSFVGGCNDYVTKPVHKTELLAKITSLTGYQSRSMRG